MSFLTPPMKRYCNSQQNPSYFLYYFKVIPKCTKWDFALLDILIYCKAKNYNSMMMRIQHISGTKDAETGPPTQSADDDTGHSKYQRGNTYSQFGVGQT